MWVLLEDLAVCRQQLMLFVNKYKDWVKSWIGCSPGVAGAAQVAYGFEFWLVARFSGAFFADDWCSGRRAAYSYYCLCFCY